jgi:hypothetical protein
MSIEMADVARATEWVIRNARAGHYLKHRQPPQTFIAVRPTIRMHCLENMMQTLPMRCSGRHTLLASLCMNAQPRPYPCSIFPVMRDKSLSWMFLGENLS